VRLDQFYPVAERIVHMPPVAARQQLGVRRRRGFPLPGRQCLRVAPDIIFAGGTLSVAALRRLNRTVRRRSSPVPSRALKSWIVIAVFALNIVGRGRRVEASAD